MAVGFLNPRDSAHTTAVRPAHVPTALGEQRWNTDAGVGTIPFSQDSNAILALFRNALAHYGVTDTEGDDDALTEIIQAAISTGVLALAGGTMTGEIIYATGSVSAGATTDIASVPGNFVSIIGSGGATVTSLGTGTSIGQIKLVRANVAFTLHHDPAAITLPGSADIAVAVGDFFIAKWSSGNFWRVVSFQRGDGTPLIFAPPSTTISGLPAAASYPGQGRYVTDLGGGAGWVVSNGVTWRRLREHGTAKITSNAIFTLTPLASAPDIFHTGTLTGNRAVTLATTNAYDGARFRITRTGSGAFTLDVGTGPLKSLATNTWGEFVYDGVIDNAWKLAAYGTL